MISNSTKSSHFTEDNDNCAPPQKSVVSGKSDDPTEDICQSEDMQSDDDAAVAFVIEDSNKGKAISFNEPTSTEVEPDTQDKPIPDVDVGDVENASNNGDKDSSSVDDALIVGDVENASNNGDKDSSSVDDALIHKADSGGAEEDEENEGGKGSSLTSDKVETPSTQQEGKKDDDDESSSSSGNVESNRNLTGKSMTLHSS
jgi:hypothetical protein